jgi:hypothetical protein
VRYLGSLSDVEFEQLASDLLRAESGRAYERFGVGPDGGIDLRYVDRAAGIVEVVQCKHYLRSSFAQLNAAAKLEPPKLQAQSPTPTSYRFITSQSLTVGQKDKLIQALDGWISDPGRIWGAEQIDDLLDAHPDVEQRHVKLWLSSSVQLAALVNAGTLNRSHDLVERIIQALPRYVQTQRFSDAQALLSKQGVCLIAGEPGIGKTTLAQMLLLDCARQGFEPLHVSEDIGEAWDVIADRPQAFYYDDFLGRIGLSGLRKNEDQRLVALLARAQRQPRMTRVILTTREYILRGAVQLYESFQRADLDHDRFLLALKDYTRYERGLVLYNHLYHSSVMKPEWLLQLVQSRAYVSIIEHPNYNPRLIEFVTGLAQPRELEHVGEDWVSFAIGSLDNPTAIWERAFEHELNHLQRAALVCLISFGAQVGVESLRLATESYCTVAGVGFEGNEFTSALKTLELTFLRIGRAGERPVVDVANPSVSDYLAQVVGADERRVRLLLDGAVFFRQPEQLWELATSRDASGTGEKLKAMLARSEDHLARCFLRLLDTAEPWPDSSGVSSRRRLSRASREARLQTMIDACGAAVLADQKLFQRLRRELSDLEVRWPEGGFDRRAAVALYSTLLHGSCDVLMSPSLGPTLKAAIRDGSEEVDDFDILDDLWRADPDLFDIGERQEIAEEFEDYAYDLLGEHDIGLEEIEMIESVAIALDVELADVALEKARSRHDHESDIDDERRSLMSGHGNHTQSDALHDLFARLVGSRTAAPAPERST